MGPSTESLALADFLISKLGLQVDRISLAYAIMDHVEIEYSEELSYEDRIAELEAALAARQPVGEPVAWQSMATCPRDGTAVLLRWGEDHVSPGWWCAAVSPIQNEDGTWPRETGGFPWAFFDMNDGVAFVNHAVDTEYGPTHWAPYVYPAAQAVDLGAVRQALQAAEGLATICASVDGYSREEVAASGRAMKQQFADALAKVDSQAVGK